MPPEQGKPAFLRETLHMLQFFEAMSQDITPEPLGTFHNPPLNSLCASEMLCMEEYFGGRIISEEFYSILV